MTPRAPTPVGLAEGRRAEAGGEAGTKAREEEETEDPSCATVLVLLRRRGGSLSGRRVRVPERGGRVGPKPFQVSKPPLPSFRPGPTPDFPSSLTLRRTPPPRPRPSPVERVQTSASSPPRFYHYSGTLLPAAWSPLPARPLPLGPWSCRELSSTTPAPIYLLAGLPPRCPPPSAPTSLRISPSFYLRPDFLRPGLRPSPPPRGPHR